MTDALIERAIRTAKLFHAGQTDDSGADFFTAHCQVVGDIVSMLTNDSEVIASAYLHDVIEDTKCTHEMLKHLFGNRVADLVHEVTHTGEYVDGQRIFPRLQSREAILIKFADRASNLSRMDAWTQERRQEYLNKSKFWKQ